MDVGHIGEDGHYYDSAGTDLGHMNGSQVSLLLYSSRLLLYDRRECQVPCFLFVLAT